MTRLSIALALILAACGGSEKKDTTATNKMTAASGEDNHALCMSFFQRQRECTDTFIPTLVAARVAADKPAGIAAEDAEHGRDALVAKAMEEWKVDSTDEAIDAMCTKILEQPPAQEDIETGKSCMAEAECQAFSDCAVGLTSKHF